jgi:hypothetical protein
MSDRRRYMLNQTLTKYLRHSRKLTEKQFGAEQCKCMMYVDGHQHQVPGVSKYSRMQSGPGIGIGSEMTKGRAQAEA